MALSDLQKALVANNFQPQEPILKALIRYIDLLKEWNEHINLTAHRELSDLIEKDIIDSFYLANYIQIHRPEFKTAIDLGCGAGFSGFVLALLNPNALITFLDANRKKINFIRQVARELQLGNCYFLNERAREKSDSSLSRYEVIISRATWQAVNFIKHGPYYVQNKGVLLLMSGVSQSKPSLESLEQQGLEGASEFFYEIKPKGYQRKIFIFKPTHFT
jgi:16S rRNA (guanine527-N7)-methyltransferase